MSSESTISFPRDELRDSASLLSKEWLVTNGLGGYASSTIHGVATRRYHGTFVPDLPSPWGRTIIMPRLDEELSTEAGSVLVSGVEYEDGRLDSDLPNVIAEFRFLKKQGDRSMQQLDDEQFFVTLDAESNSVAIIVKHLAGNMRSRWMDFLTSDG